MKITKLKITVIFTVLSILILPALHESIAQERTKTFQVNPGGSLTISISPGNITINTWSKKELMVEIKDLEDEDLKEVEAKQSGNEIEITYEGSSGWSDDAEFFITIPTQFNLNMKTTGGNIDIKNDLEGSVKGLTAGGDINTKNINGMVKLSTSGGNIKTGDVSGDLNLNTQGGNITAGTVKMGETKVITMGGNIVIKNVSSNLEAKTYGGNIDIGDVGGNAEVTTFGGNINLDRVTGSAEMNTYGGNITLKSASGKVDAKTQGGNLSLKNITGSIEAYTAAGNIFVELIPSGKGKSSIKTTVGNIELRIPETAKASIEAVIEYYGGWDDSEDFKVYSDFEAQTYNVNKDKNEIYAKYILNGGGEEIKLKTTNSDIKINKIK